MKAHLAFSKATDRAEDVAKSYEHLTEKKLTPEEMTRVEAKKVDSPAGAGRGCHVAGVGARCSS